MIKKILHGFAAMVLVLGLGAGVVAAQSGDIDTTGPDSTNKIEFENEHETDLENKTEFELDVENDQEAKSGEAKTMKNTEAGDAETGDAENMFSLAVSGEVDNRNSNSAALEACGCDSDSDASIERTGPDSYNKVEFDNKYEVKVENETELKFDIDNKQEAKSGDATVYRNTEGGDATTGNASNSSSIEIDFVVRN